MPLQFSGRCLQHIVVLKRLDLTGYFFRDVSKSRRRHPRREMDVRASISCVRYPANTIPISRERRSGIFKLVRCFRIARRLQRPVRRRAVDYSQVFLMNTHAMERPYHSWRFPRPTGSKPFAVYVPHPVSWTHFCATRHGVARMARALRVACDTPAFRGASTGCSVRRTQRRRRARRRGFEAGTAAEIGIGDNHC